MQGSFDFESTELETTKNDGTLELVLRLPLEFKEHLSWAAEQKSKTESQIVIDLIKKDMWHSFDSYHFWVKDQI